MKYNHKIILFIGAAILSISLLFQNCATIIESTCTLEQFDGTFVGTYNVGGLLNVPVPDTVLVEVNLEDNEAKITSISLDTFFVCKFSDAKNRLTIAPLNVPEFSFNEIELSGISIGGGFISLDSECDKLFIQMDQLNVDDHNISGLPKPIRNLDLTTPSFMKRL